MEKLCDNLRLYILTPKRIDEFFEQDNWLDQKHLKKIFELYDYSNNSLTAILEDYYVDAAYRDVYYNYWARLHYDWPRYCKRLFLFMNAHEADEFFNYGKAENLGEDFLGTIVIRQAYSKEKDHTLGRTLLDPYRMSIVDSEGNKIKPFVYLETTEYKAHLLGRTYCVKAFPFSSQDGAAMRCAETAIYVLCDFASTKSCMYARVLPSDIQNSLKQRLAERILPSQGLYCNDISYLLREFKFSPMIYAASDNTDSVGNGNPSDGILTSRIGLVCEETADHEGQKDNPKAWDDAHKTDFKDWFHYYVESAIPVLAITAPNQEVNKHATLVIGHGRNRKALDDCKTFKLGGLPCVDTAEFYDQYILQDDNQIPYVEEKIDEFTQKHNYKLEAFIVPLERHVFLEAASAVSICDTFIDSQKERIKEAIAVIAELLKTDLGKKDKNKEVYFELIDAVNVSEDNPITVRYYLANSADYKQKRISNSENIAEKKFYASVLMPKSVWVAEISTYKMYKTRYAFGEVVLDATASSKSKVNSIILLRTAHMGVYRLLSESYSDFEQKIAKDKDNADLSVAFAMYSNFGNQIPE